MISALSQRVTREALLDSSVSLRAVLMCAVFSLTSLGIASDAAAADEAFTIHHAETRLVNKVYQLSADLDYSFSDEVREAIDSGVPMVLVTKLGSLSQCLRKASNISKASSPCLVAGPPTFS